MRTPEERLRNDLVRRFANAKRVEVTADDINGKGGAEDRKERSDGCAEED